jgi:parvulin-like peptidyl-prolyl isomerase
MHFKPSLALKIAIIVTMIFVLGCQRGPDLYSEGKVIAEVNGEKLTLEEIEDQIPAEYRDYVSEYEKKEYAEEWIKNELLYQEAVASKFDSDPKIQARLRQITKQLVASAFVEEELKARSTVDSSEVREFYENNLSNLTRDKEEVRLSHIFVRTKEAADSAYAALRAGEDFALVAQRLSEDLKSSQRGGDLGFFSSENLDPSLAAVASRLSVGSYSKAIESGYGYHLIKVTDRKKKGTIREFELVKEDIHNQLLAEKQRGELEILLSELEAKSEVVRYDPGDLPSESSKEVE